MNLSVIDSLKRVRHPSLNSTPLETITQVQLEAEHGIMAVDKVHSALTGCEWVSVLCLLEMGLIYFAAAVQCCALDLSPHRADITQMF